MTRSEDAALHDAYAADYDAQVRAYDCHIAEVLFGLCFDALAPGERLLDAGIGSGLSAELFAKAGLCVYGIDFSPAMLDICRAKGFATDLLQHDLSDIPWPYSSNSFHHVACCGVLHFIDELDGVIGEVARVLMIGGRFSFTTRLPGVAIEDQAKHYRLKVGEFDIFSHERGYIESLLLKHGLERQKMQRCFVGEDIFMLWIARKCCARPVG